MQQLPNYFTTHRETKYASVYSVKFTLLSYQNQIAPYIRMELWQQFLLPLHLIPVSSTSDSD